MNTAATADLRYPIGKLALPARFDVATRAAAIAQIAALPTMLHEAVRGLDRQHAEVVVRLEETARRQHDLETELGGVLASKSWRLTKPLRDVRRTLKRRLDRGRRVRRPE